jgi:hypothetical protein
MPALESRMTRKAVLSGSGKGGEKRLGNETSLAVYFIALPQSDISSDLASLFCRFCVNV